MCLFYGVKKEVKKEVKKGVKMDNSKAADSIRNYRPARSA